MSFIRTCYKCGNIFMSGERCDLCYECDPIKIRGTCVRCWKFIMMNEDYAHDDDALAVVNYVCLPCWKKDPHHRNLRYPTLKKESSLNYI
jgi:hypothetical protein